MGTAAAVQRRTTFLPERGTWSARDDRTQSAVVLGLFWVGVIAGFGTDLRRYFHEKPAPPTVVHVHAVVFTIWLLIFTAQVLMVVGDRVAWHRRFGWFAAGWAGLMAIMGPWAAMAAMVAHRGTPDFDPPFLVVNILDIGGFLILLGWGLTLRKNPAAHKRIMMLSLIAMADPGFARFSFPFCNPTSLIPWFAAMFYGNVLLIAVMAVWDWRKGRVIRQFVLGASALLAAFVAASVLYFWGPWRVVTLRWVEAWARWSG
jgi:hypothetical protein